MLMKRLYVLLFALLPLAALAQSETQLIEKWKPLVGGSEANAKVLVTGLRDGSDFKIGSTTFDPPTGKMGYGSIDNALALAQQSLPANPTAEQLKAALIGTTDKPGVLALRAEGMGWGQIAQSMGVKLGEVKRSERASERVAARPERAEKPARPEKPERPERPAKPERPGR
jgi:hypothetical protein